jgi:hypothetical protein
MTTSAIELKKKLDKNISQFRETELQKMYEFSQFLLLYMMPNKQKPPQKNSNETSEKVWYNGKLYNPKTIKFLSGPVNHDSDETVEEIISQHIQEKYK